MKRFEHIVIASDLDGTFLGEGSQVVSRNLEAIEYFKENGGHFTFSTGRTSHIVLPAIPMTPSLLNMPAVTGNGTCLYDFSEEKAIEEHFLPYDLICEVADFFVQKAPDLAMRASTTVGMLAYDKEHPIIQREYARLGPDYFFRPLSEWKDVGVYKLAIRGGAKRIEEVFPSFSAQFGDRAELACSATTLLDMQIKNRTKAQMLRDLVARSFDTPTVLCAVGDQENDLEMLRIADLACCPDNAIDAVKDASPLHFCSNDEGVIGDIVEYLDTHDVSHLATRK